MKLLVFCLLVGLCCSWGQTAPKEAEIRKLNEVLWELGRVRDSLQVGFKPILHLYATLPPQEGIKLNFVVCVTQHSDKMLNSPPASITDGCCLSALECFRANMRLHFNLANRIQSKLHKSLNHSSTIQGVTFCDTGANTTTCHSCDSHPKVKAQEFFNRLESLIQRAITKLSLPLPMEERH